MRRNILYSCLAFAIFIVPIAFDAVVEAQNSVTVRVNMSIKMREGTFNPGAGDIVRVAGSFNDWGNSTDTLKSSGPGDSIYTKTVSLAAGSIQYKFLKTLRGGLDWEGGDNKTYTVVAGSQAIPVVWFDNDSVFTPAANVAVTFRVNMRVKMLEQGFLPGSGDIVRVAGSFNDWGSSTDTLKKGATDSIYSKSVTMLEGTQIQYKYLKTPRGGSDWEGGDNKTYTVPTGGGSVNLTYFDGDEVVNTPTSGSILWRVDMSTFATMGWFQRSNGDSIEVRGAFNSWGGTKMIRVPGTETYEVAIPYTGGTFDDLDFKFFIDFDSAGAVARFPGYIHSGSTSTRDGFAYDHPSESGDGNRKFNLGAGGNLQTPAFRFSSIPLAGTIKTGDTVTVVFRYDMRPAMAYIDPFVRGVDTAKIAWQDALQKSFQGNPPDLVLKDDGVAPDAVAGDSIYSGRMNIRGPAHYNLQYTMTYVHGGTGTGSVSEGGGLGVQAPYRSRFIRPLSSQTFPRTYTLPIDVWQKAAPMPVESFDGLTGIDDDIALGTPGVFTLFQNYPNPFNPSTHVKYSLPQQEQVRLRVFNLLGQVVADLVNEVQPAGNHVTLFEASSLPTGVYFYELRAGLFREVKRMVLLK